ncbi:MAG: molybdate ABC transporter substrate-binding protein [bacterium]
MKKIYPKFKHTRILFVTATLLVACFSEPNTGNQTVTISAAASLATVLPQICQAFAKDYPDVKLSLNFAASSILAKQIDHGARVDLFLSANRDWVDYLQEKEKLQAHSRRDFLKNRLVLIAARKSAYHIESLHDLVNPELQRIALADWSHVPAGIYAKQALTKSGVWAAISAKCIPALDVRAALTYIERGDAACGIVYKTDAAISDRVGILFELPAEFQPEIVYSAALTSQATGPLARTFLDFLLSPAAAVIWEEYGFVFSEHE